MRFSEEQLMALKPYHKNFETAVESRWARNPGRKALGEIAGIWNEVQGSSEVWDFNCGTCILRLLTECGSAYLADVAERNRLAPRLPTRLKARGKVEDIEISKGL